MRRPRIKAEGAAYYHCVSRIIEKRMILGATEKHRLIRLMRSLAAFGGLHILSYCFMSNHFHILVHVPERQELSDNDFIQRLLHIYSPEEVDLVGRQLDDLRSGGFDQAAENLKSRYTYRMYDISEFFKAMKQRFSQYYNVREGRTGPLWEDRFRSVLVERSEHALLTIAAYIELNPVRGGLVSDPKDYRASSYGAAVGGDTDARQSLCLLMRMALDNEEESWNEVQEQYRKHLYVQGMQRGIKQDGAPARRGFTPDQVRSVIQAGGRLPMHEVLRCRVRYFSDGLALGGRAYVEGIFIQHRGHFGSRRQTGARPLRFAEWPNLCTLRELRTAPVSR